MQMFDFYVAEGFKLFPCNIDKTPRVSSWRSTECHIDADSAERMATNGTYIGAWPPPNYVIIDVDRNHKDKQGNVKPDGLPIFEDLCAQIGIHHDLSKYTRTVKTGSGGIHLYFTLPPEVDYRTIAAKAIVDSVDVKTPAGYVIAAGTYGYSVVNDVPPQQIPAELLTLIQTRNKDKAKEYRPARELPVEVLQKVLAKVPATEFSNNDEWQEFVTSCIAVSGTDPEVLDAIEEWSKSDPAYTKDPSIRKRIETFEVAGGITAGTFIHVIKNVGVSKYLVDKVRMFVGAQFNISERFAETLDPPFEVDYSVIKEYESLSEAYYYSKNQRAGVELFTHLVAGNLIYVESERSFFYFDGNRWVEESGVLNIVSSVLISAMIHYYTDVSKHEKGDADADEYITSLVNYTSTYAVLGKFEYALKQHSAIGRKSVPWDSPDLEATLTLRDCVMDFSDKGVKFRQGRREEYRLLYIDLSKSDFENHDTPANFKQFLKDVFPDEETRKTATYALSTMISGTGRFRKFQLWNGSGRNGKSTLMEIMKYVIGSRAISYKPETLLSQSHTQSLTPELAVFRGALAAFSSETEESKRISQGKVKTLTGNETITANPKYKDLIEFKTTFQLVLATNYLPTFSAHDIAFIDRVIVLPFYTCFYETEEQKDAGKRKGSRYFIEAKDVTKLTKEIEKERAQILYYLAVRYQEVAGGIIPESPECLHAKSHYVDDNNDIFKFFEEFIEYGEGAEKAYFTPTRDLVDFYNSENNTKYSSKFVVTRLKEVYPPDVETCSKKVDGKLTRGLKGVRIKYGAYPEGWQGNYSAEEVERLRVESSEF